MAKKTKPDLKEVKKNVMITAEVDNFIHETLKEIRDKSNLGDYDINYRFSSKKKCKGNQAVHAEIIVDPRYLNAHITLRPEIVELYKLGKYDRIRDTLCHEIAHIRTEKLAQIAMERFTTPSEVRQELETLTEIVGRLMHDNVFNRVPAKTISNKKKLKK